MIESDLMGPTTGNVRNVVNTLLIAAADFILMVILSSERPLTHIQSPLEKQKLISFPL